MQGEEGTAVPHQPGSFLATVELVQAYVRSDPGSWSAVARQARADPEGTARSLLNLGTVLLDLAAGAFRLTPEEVLDKVTRTVDLQRLEQAHAADSR